MHNVFFTTLISKDQNDTRMKGGKTNNPNKKLESVRNENDLSDSTWGSLHDSELIVALNNNEINTDVDTDVDTEDDNINNNTVEIQKSDQNKVLNLKKSPNNEVISISEDWGSMSDSQFKSFVNKLSQYNKVNSSKVFNNSKLSSDNINVNDTVPIDNHQIDILVTPKPKPKSKSINNISSSPILFAQRLNESENDIINDDHNHIEILEDSITERDLEDSEKFEFNNHEEYFKVKAAKQDMQDKEFSKFLKGSLDDNNIDNKYPPIFSNCSIHINGRTEPDILQLKKMIILHGGKYIHYLSSKGAATHIIAESLPPRKRIQFNNCKVVTPKWIVESILAKKLLNWADYRLEQLSDYGQKSIESHFHKIKNKDDNINQVKEELETNNKIDPCDIENNDDNNNNEDEYLSQEFTKTGIDAKDPNFLKIFFSKSRLHHLSTWKLDLRAEFLDKAMKLLKERESKVENNVQLPKNRVILHVDFDCFFATVSAKMHNPPLDLKIIPCCVTHGGSSADISSCNYIARKFGVKNGMWFSRAKTLCPDIICLPYQFDEYEKISKIFYKKLLSLNFDSILPVSIDEALVDISSLCKSCEDADGIFEVVSKIKKDLDLSTGCTVSCGCGSNILLAKLALRRAKPDGIYVVSNDHEKMISFLNDISVKNLPGFGNKLNEKLLTLNNQNKETITLKDLRNIPKDKLIATFGIKTGTKLYDQSRGIDDTSIDLLSDPEKYLRKSIGIDINWGIRFNTNIEVEEFLNRLAAELSKRLMNCGMIGSTLTLKLSVRHPDAPIEPAKYMGMGYCNFVSKSSRLGVSTRVQGVLSSEMKYLWRVQNIEPKDLRGVGVSMTKLTVEKSSKGKVDNQMKLDFGGRSKKSNYDKIEENPMLKPSDNIIKVKSSPIKRRKDDFLDEEIDWDVFDNLPSYLQEEIKRELRRRNLQSSPKKRKTYSNNKDIAVMLSPSKMTPKEKFVNEGVFLITPEKLKQKLNTELTFQSIPLSDEKEIIKKLLYWMNFTFKKGSEIDERDLSLFKDFMIKLLTIKEHLRYDRILKSMFFHLELNKNCLIYNVWLSELKELEKIFNDQSYLKFVFEF